ncbi:MAG TPA: hypothetical protein VFA98_06560 [Thermoanaerobaculia bacterium]|nr:hypothetical protein [Thermoanaerobaculia bacterium]
MKAPIFALLVTCSRPAAPADAGPLADAGTEDTPPAPKACRDGAGIWHLPNPEWTPGKVCTHHDVTFKEMRYGGRVAACVRYVTLHEKEEIAKKYGIPREDFKKYEFDHFIPLSAGGSDDQTNIWPQPIAEAHEKDKLEIEVYNALSDGTIDQDEAISRIRAWRPTACPP